MDEKMERIEERKALWKSGCILGVILAVSAVLILSVSGEQKAVLDFMKWFPLILAGYLLAGVFLMWRYASPSKRRRGQKAAEYIRGISLVTIGQLLLLAVAVLAGFLSPVVRLPLAANVITLLILWIVDYSASVRLCKELNGKNRASGRALLYDLDECPKSREAFWEEIEKYCAKNHIDLAYIEKNNPAIVTLDGVPHMVMVEHSYHRFGPLYSLKFEELGE